MGAIRMWLRARTALELLALGAGVAVFGYLGWDSALWDPRLQLVLHLVAVGSAGALAVAWYRGTPMPVPTMALPLLALLAAYALATVSALNLGMSLRAMGSVTAFAVALPLALVAVRHRPSWVGLVTALPVLAFAVPTLAVLAWRRLEWILAGAPGLPPLRMEGEGTPFGSVAVPPYVIWPAWALAGLIEEERWRRPVRIGLVAVGIPLTILSGSRSAWLAVAGTAVIIGVPWLWQQRGRLGVRDLLRGRGLLVSVGGLAAAALVIALALPRLTAVTSLVYRVGLWRDTLAAWATDPLLGIGPGFMPYARQAAAADFTFPVRQPHSHNLPLGVLGDAGLLGLLAAVVLVVTLVVIANPWRTRSPVARSAAVVLVGLAIGGLSEDLTFLPNFNLLAVTLLAVVLLDVGAVRWVRRDPANRRQLLATAVPAAAIGIALLTAMVMADAGAIAYRMGLDRAAERRWPDAVAWFERSAAIDRWHPTTPKSLAVVADAAGDDALARRAAEEAVARNPGDGASWLNLSFACATLGDDACRRQALDRTVATASLGGPEMVNAALGYEALGLSDEADGAFRRAVLSQRLTTLAIDWPRAVDIGTAETEEAIGPDAELNRLLGRWAMDEPIDPEAMSDPRARAVAHAMRGEEAEADAELERAIDAAPEEPLTWELAVVLRSHWGRPVTDEVRIAEAVRGGPFPARETSEALPTITWDIASFRGWPMDGLALDADRVRPPLNFPWALEAVLP
ncbi:MAG: O-antigen ligase family protein [Chloroflexota bacterium]|nr:O-antigen ligase family protein [Chloroflexota bacterium]